MLITCSNCRKTLFVGSSPATADESRVVCDACGQELWVGAAGGVRFGQVSANVPSPLPEQPQQPAMLPVTPLAVPFAVPESSPPAAADDEDALWAAIAQPAKSPAPVVALASEPKPSLSPPSSFATPIPPEPLTSSTGLPSLFAPPVFAPPVATPADEAQVSPMFSSGPLWPQPSTPPAVKRDAEGDELASALDSISETAARDEPRPKTVATTPRPVAVGRIAPKLAPPPVGQQTRAPQPGRVAKGYSAAGSRRPPPMPAEVMTATRGESATVLPPPMPRPGTSAAFGAAPVTAPVVTPAAASVAASVAAPAAAPAAAPTVTPAVTPAVTPETSRFRWSACCIRQARATPVRSCRRHKVGRREGNVGSGVEYVLQSGE